MRPAPTAPAISLTAEGVAAAAAAAAAFIAAAARGAADPHTPVLTPEQLADFRSRGVIMVRGLVRPEELAEAGAVFERLMSGELKVEGKDHGQHTPGLMNVTAFSLYHDIATLGVFATIEARAAAVTAQLHCGGMAMEYNQLLRKLPNQPGARFPTHQDAQYWPKSASGAFDMRTATISIAVNDASRDNGCLWALSGSHASGWVYPRRVSRVAESRQDGGGVIELHLNDEDAAARHFLELKAGDATIHEEWIVHGSDGNACREATRDTLIFAYRAASMIAAERSVGFRHSYNDGEAVLRLVRDAIFP